MTVDWYLQQLEPHAKLFAAPRLSKLLQSPGKLIASRLAAQRARRFGKPTRKTAKLFWGDRMEVVLPDQVALAIYRYGFVEEGLVRLIAHHLRPGEIFFDVGAHFGFFTMLASSIVGEKGQVHAFEPTPSTFAVLKENADTRRNVIVNNVAMFSQEGIMPFKDFGPGLSAFNSLFSPRLAEDDSRKSGHTTHQVQSLTVDGYIEKSGVKPSFIKIDAESAEVAILKGMTRTLEEYRPLIAIEVGDYSIEGAGDSAEIVRTMLAAKYVGIELGADKRPIRHKEQARYGSDNLLFIPQECRELLP